MRVRLAERDCDGNMLRWQGSSLRLFCTPLEGKNAMQTPECSIYSQAETCRVQIPSPLALWRWDATGTTYTDWPHLNSPYQKRPLTGQTKPQCLSSAEEQTVEDLTWHIIFHDIHLSLTQGVNLHAATQLRSKAFTSGVFSGLWKPCFLLPRGPPGTSHHHTTLCNRQEGGRTPEKVGTRCKIRT